MGANRQIREQVGGPGASGMGPVPQGNAPGHHPDREQDRPDLDELARRLGAAPPGDDSSDPDGRVDAEPAGRGRARAGALAAVALAVGAIGVVVLVRRRRRRRDHGLGAARAVRAVRHLHPGKVLVATAWKVSRRRRR